MAIEYTQVFSFVIGTTGPSGLQYCQLGAGLSPTPSGFPPPAGSVFAVKYVSVSCTSIITNQISAVDAWNIQAVVSTTNVAPAGSPIYSVQTGGTIAANTVTNLFQSRWGHTSNTTSPFTEFIMIQQYLGINVNLQSAGTLTVTVSYLVIPQTNTLIANFGKSATSTVPGLVTVLTPSTSTEVVQSIIAINYTDPSATNTYVCSPVLLNAANTILAYLGKTETLATGQAACWNTPIYLPANTTNKVGLNVTSGAGTAAVSIYCSYLNVDV